MALSFEPVKIIKKSRIREKLEKSWSIDKRFYDQIYGATPTKQVPVQELDSKCPKWVKGIANFFRRIM